MHVLYKSFRKRSSEFQCWTHFHVDKVFHVGQGNLQQIAHQVNVPLFHSQMQQCLVTFDFLEFEEQGVRVGSIMKPVIKRCHLKVKGDRENERDCDITLVK